MSEPGPDDRVLDPVSAGPPPPIDQATPRSRLESATELAAESAPEITVDRWAHRRAEPRPLALLWTIFLALSTMICLASLAARGATSYESYRPAARSLLTIVAIGLTVLWPMVRLSQSPARSPIAAWVWKDLVVLLLPAQAVIWPQVFFFLAKWPTEVVGCVSAMLSAWAILTGALLAWASTLVRREALESPRRASFMLIVLALVAVGPLLSLPFRASGRTDTSSPAFDVWGMTSPVTAVFELTRDRLWTGQPARVVAAHWWAVAIVAASAVFAWISFGIWSRARSGRDFLDLIASNPRAGPHTNI